jgi:alanine racemase
MVRIGLGIYGGSTDIQDELQIVSSFSTEIIQIKHVASGQTVGYSRRGNIDAYSRIAVLPVGYADGISRKLSGGVGKVWINGKLAPIVGNVSMNIISIDITNIDAKLGDRAYFFAPEYPIDKLAEQLGTIPYEIITAITDRIPRVYFILKKD